MFLSRLALLALVMLGACEQTPDYSACKLVGWWKNEMPGGSDGKAWTTTRETMFRANGYALSGYTEWVPWVLVKDDGQQVVIQYPKEVHEGMPRERIFLFENPDQMHEVDADLGEIIWTRFEGPK